MLVPTLSPGDIVVLDNLASHKRRLACDFSTGRPRASPAAIWRALRLACDF